MNDLDPGLQQRRQRAGQRSVDPCGSLGTTEDQQYGSLLVQPQVCSGLIANFRPIKIADRNQRVTVQYMDGSTKENVKYKVVEQDVESGKAVVIA
jgi:preprotein translocase subunit SecA